MSSSNTLRSQAEFFLGGVIPVEVQPSNCAICTESLDSDVIQILACKHTFHLVCVLHWFQSTAARRGSCPNCRRELYEPKPLPAAVAGPHVQTRWGPGGQDSPLYGPMSAGIGGMMDMDYRPELPPAYEPVDRSFETTFPSLRPASPDNRSENSPGYGPGPAISSYHSPTYFRYGPEPLSPEFRISSPSIQSPRFRASSIHSSSGGDGTFHVYEDLMDNDENAYGSPSAYAVGDQLHDSPASPSSRTSSSSSPTSLRYGSESHAFLPFSSANPRFSPNFSLTSPRYSPSSSIYSPPSLPPSLSGVSSPASPHYRPESSTYSPAGRVRASSLVYSPTMPSFPCPPPASYENLDRSYE